MSLDGAVSGVTFTAYFPFVVLTAIFLGWRSAMLTTVLSALAANFLFMAPRYELSASVNDVASTLLFLASASGVIFATGTLRTAARAGDLDRTWSRPARAVGQRWSLGQGLLLGAALSLALWGGAIWAVARLFH
jgi:hypothetical protein